MVVKRSSKKHAAPKKSTTTGASKRVDSKSKKVSSRDKDKQVNAATTADTKKSLRPADEVVTYSEFEYELKEVTPEGSKILIGPPWLTRFERARITGARSLQLSLGAPPLIKVPEKATSSIAIAVEEIEQKALPISIRRILPNGLYQDIPIEWMK